MTDGCQFDRRQFPKKHRSTLLSGWAKSLQAGAEGQRARISPGTQLSDGGVPATAGQCDGGGQPGGRTLQGPAEFSGRPVALRVQQGFSSVETATFIFSFKQPLFEALRSEAGKDANVLRKDLERHRAAG